MSDGIIETSDLNDGDILAKTTQVPCKGGNQFKFVLPDGHEIKSECVSDEHKKTALHRWVDVVKEAVVARARSEREELAAKIRRRKVEEQMAAEAASQQLIVPTTQASREALVPEGTSARSSAVSTPAQSAPSATARVSVPTNGADPVAMAKAQLVEATLEMQELTPKLVDAKRRVAQWQAVLNALQGVELPPDNTVIETDAKLRDVLERR